MTGNPLKVLEATLETSAVEYVVLTTSLWIL